MANINRNINLISNNDGQIDLLWVSLQVAFDTIYRYGTTNEYQFDFQQKIIVFKEY